MKGGVYRMLTKQATDGKVDTTKKEQHTDSRKLPVRMLF